MSNENPENQKKKEISKSDESIDPKVLPAKKVSELFHSLEIMSMEKKGKDGLDFSKLDKDQIHKVIDIMAANEENALIFHTKKLDTKKEIAIKKIDASVVEQKTTRYNNIFAIIFISIITLSILFFKETYFIPWLTFLTGLIGGFGWGRSRNNSNIKSEES